MLDLETSSVTVPLHASELPSHITLSAAPLQSTVNLKPGIDRLATSDGFGQTVTPDPPITPIVSIASSPGPGPGPGPRIDLDSETWIWTFFSSLLPYE
ncbi:hypothetical protein G7046_g5184 [Stylonectria norvegica]|nr:hypothetical protein G7046_g5184 [Stylonectria norvegica]